MTPEEEQKIALLRILLGDTEGSPFYPILADEEYVMLLQMFGWDVRKTLRQAAYSVLLQLSKVNYRERTGDIEVWNNASIEYRKAVADMISEDSSNLPSDLTPWVGGSNAEEMCALVHSKNFVRHPLASISHCSSWWTRVKNIDCLRGDGYGYC